MENVLLVDLIAFVFLTAMEIVLGIDNIVFLAIVTGRLPEAQQPKARRLGLIAAMGMRILLLLCLSAVMGLTAVLFRWSQLGLFSGWLLAEEHRLINEVTARDLVLLAGGLFLIAKSVMEVHAQLEGPGQQRRARQPAQLWQVLLQIVVLDMVFSLDSVITAIGMANALWVMIAAIIAAVCVMLVFAEVVSRFVQGNPTIKMLALSFLLLIGVLLVADAIGTEVDKGYIYFAMAFALVVEVLNLRVRARQRQAGAQPA